MLLNSYFTFIRILYYQNDSFEDILIWNNIQLKNSQNTTTHSRGLMQKE
ncbi:hypothetical protein T10_5726 [Trichinella papuae]|uniref:Uncharacterized protein n=1 Tax=Trichinella papuae TaxID=268474 RepID=A0A0V1LZX8_9BILA|nr:hypothetical protein T10_5726 [Trichinella papuae]